MQSIIEKRVAVISIVICYMRLRNIKIEKNVCYYITTHIYIFKRFAATIFLFVDKMKSERLLVIFFFSTDASVIGFRSQIFS